MCMSVAGYNISRYLAVDLADVDLRVEGLGHLDLHVSVAGYSISRNLAVDLADVDLSAEGRGHLDLHWAVGGDVLAHVQEA